jgi:protein phosphatase
MTAMEYFALTDTGKWREQNEDFFYADKESGLFIVADGMGGHNAGEVASKLAVESFVNRFTALKENKNSAKDQKVIQSKDKNAEILAESFNYANHMVYEMSESKKSLNGMGTTFTCCYIENHIANIVHIGDSRIYFAANGAFELLTEDHTLVGEMYKKGLITYEEMFGHPMRNYLNKVIGTDPETEFDFITKELKTDDILILCTDGLNSMLTDQQIFSIVLKQRQPKKITEELVKAAIKMGGRDNITVITIKKS